MNFGFFYQSKSTPIDSVFGENTVRFYHVHVRLPVCFRTCNGRYNELYVYYVPRNDSDLSQTNFKLWLTHVEQLAVFTAFFNLLVFEFPVIHLFAFDFLWALHLRRYDFLHEFISNWLKWHKATGSAEHDKIPRVHYASLKTTCQPILHQAISKIRMLNF